MRRYTTLLAAFALIATACTTNSSEDTTTTTVAPAETTPTTQAAPVNSPTTTTSEAPAPDLSIATDGVTVTDDTIYLGFLADLVETVPTYHLRRSASLDELDTLLDALRRNRKPPS